MDIDLHKLSTYDVLNLWAGSAAEMKRRNLLRTNNVVGELAEAIAHRHLGGTRGHFSEKGWDVHTPEGAYVQVKGLWRTTPSRTKLSAIRDDNYDSLMIIIFGLHFDLSAAYQASRETIERLCAWNSHVNGRQPTVTQKLSTIPVSFRLTYPMRTTTSSRQRCRSIGSDLEVLGFSRSCG